MTDQPDPKHTRGLLLVALNDALDQLNPMEAAVLGSVLDSANQNQPPGAPASTLAVMEVVVELLRHRAQLGIDEVLDRVRIGREFLGILDASYPADDTDGEGGSGSPGA